MPDDAQKKIASTMHVLWLVPFIMVLGNSMLIPVLPQIQRALHINLLRSGLLITFFSLPAGVIIPFAGLLSDRIGRKSVMIPAIFLYGAGGILAGLSAFFLREKAFSYILASRIIQGIGAGGTYQLAMALAGDLIQSSKRAQALGLLEAANGLGKVISPVAGASIALIIWFMPFFVYGMIAFPIAVLIWIFAKESSDKKQPPPFAQYFQGLAQVARGKGVGLITSFLGGMIVLFSLFGLLSLLSDHLTKQCRVGLLPRGFIIAVPVLFMSITSYILGTILQQKITKYLKWNVVLGLVLSAAGLFLYSFLKSPAALVFAATVLGIGTGGVLPAINTLITSAAAKTERGLVTSFYGTVRFFGVAMGPPAFGYTEKLGGPLVLLAAAGLTLLIMLLSLLFIDPQKMLPREIKGGTG
ncbi:MAG: MFS transporter [Bacillota bacterium]